MARTEKQKQEKAAAREHRLKLKSQQSRIDRGLLPFSDPNETFRARVARARAFVRGEKEQGKCLDCHTAYPYFVMDYDHVRGKKIDSISELVAKGRSPTALATELAKCELVCANCHRIRTQSRLPTAA